MKQVPLRKVFRHRGGTAVRAVLEACPVPARVEDPGGAMLAGDAAADGQRHPIGESDAPVGALVGGGPLGPALATLLGALHAGEQEKRDLATETLDRYKELTLIYEMTEQLSHELEPDAIAAIVVRQAHRHLRATGASLLLHAPGERALRAVAAEGDELGPGDTLSTDRGVAGRVLRTGRAEFVEDVGQTEPVGSGGTAARALICAPLRSGERVFGVLRVSQTQHSAWTAGDLKLVTALAIHAAGALTNAAAHRERMRQLAMRHRAERLVSSALAEVIAGPGGPPGDVPVVVVLVGLTEPGRVDGGLPDADLLDRAMALQVEAVAALLAGGAVVDAPQDELLLAVFRGTAPDGALPGNPALRCIESTRRAVAELPAHRGRPLGVGVCGAVLRRDRVLGDLRAAAGRAALLQAHSEGRILADELTVSSLALPDRCRLLPDAPDPSLPRIYEVLA